MVALVLANVFVGVVIASMIGAPADVERWRRIATAAGWSLWLIYSTMEIWAGGTLGKKLFGLRIARGDGASDHWRLFLRWQTKQLPAIAAVLFALTNAAAFNLLGGFENGLIAIGCLFAANDDHLTWHDQWAGTAVFHTKALRLAQLARDGGVWAEIL